MNQKKKFCAVQQVGRAASIYIFGDIVAERWFEEDTSAHSLSEEIRGLDVDEINVFIDSYGGVVSEGWAIYNQLKQHPAKVKTYGVGFVASAALYPFMAGDERYAVEPSAYFFHNVMGGASGYAEDLRAAADELEKLTEIGMSAFTNNTGLSDDDVAALMADETWLSPQEALNLGIATAVLKERPQAGVMQSARGMIIQRVLDASQPLSTGETERQANQEPQEEEGKPPETVFQTLCRIYKND